MELKVWVEGIQRIVCGVTVNTTCQDVVFALAHATGKVGRFTLIERWRNNERLLAPNENPLKLLLKWGEYANDVQFILQRSENKQQQQQSAGNSNNNCNATSNNDTRNPTQSNSNAMIFNKKPLGLSNNNNSNNFSNVNNSTVATQEKSRELKQKSFGSFDAKQNENIGIVKGIPQRFGGIQQQQQQQPQKQQQKTSPTPMQIGNSSSSRSPNSLQQHAAAPLIPKHEKSHSNPIEMSSSSSSHQSSSNTHNFFANEQYNNNNNIYQQIGTQNSKSINEINLAVVRDSLDRRISNSNSNQVGNSGSAASPTLLNNNNTNNNNNTPQNVSQFNSSAENLLDIYNGNSMQQQQQSSPLYSTTAEIYKNAPTISANGALMPPPYRNPPPPRNSPQQMLTNSQQQPMQIGNETRNSPFSQQQQQQQHYQQQHNFNTNNPFYNNDYNCNQDYDDFEYNTPTSTTTVGGPPQMGTTSMEESESIFQATQYTDLLQLIKFQREKISAQQMELNKYDAEIVFLENKERDQAEELEAISREITKADQIFRQGSEQLQTLQYVEKENELVKQQEKTLKSEIQLLRSKLANCETELLQCKNKIRLLMDDIEGEQRAITTKQKNNRQNVERDFLMEMERIQSEIDQAIHNTDTSNKTAENLKKEILMIENAIAEKKRQVEQLVNEMKEVNLQSLTVTTSEEIKHLLEGPNKPGSSRRIIGSPRQLENAVPTSKNPHGVWV